jgi:hypothetical protein
MTIQKTSDKSELQSGPVQGNKVSITRNEGIPIEAEIQKATPSSLIVFTVDRLYEPHDGLY